MEDQPIQPKQDLGLSKETVERYLANSSSFNSPGPLPGPGVTAEEVAKAWAGEKARLVNIIVFDLRKCELLDGNEFFQEVAQVCCRQLYTANWLHPKGPIGVWRAMFHKARALAYQVLKARNAVPIQVAAQQAAFQAEMKSKLQKLKDKAAS